MSIVSIYQREECGRGLIISVEGCVESATLGLERYINDSDERLIKAARKISGGHNNKTEVELRYARKAKERKSGGKRLCTDNFYDRGKKY